ncbi:MAG: hypothetical protein AAF716_23135 [Cyanobacteria bacterium P01_D01_bin.1]
MSPLQPVENKLTGGVKIVLNNETVVTDIQLPIPKVAFAPKKFRMQTYGVHGRGPEDKIYWIGSNKGKSGIVTGQQDKEEGNNSYIFEIEREDTEEGVALKVINYKDGDPSENYYLPNLKTSPSIYVVRPPLENVRDLATDDKYNFISLELESSPNHYLRHRSYVLQNEPGDKNHIVYRQDCTWKFHEIKSK